MRFPGSLLLPLALFAAPLGAQPPQGPMPTPPSVVTTARGEARAVPDRATILFTVETRAQTAAQAGAQNATRSQAVLDALRKAGLGASQLSTVGYSMVPDVHYDPQGRSSKVVGYIARNSVRAEVERIAELGKLIDAAIAAGANGVGSLQFESSRAPEARQEALRMAMARACQDAAVLASAAGGTLGALLEAQTSEVQRPPMPYMEMAAARTMAADASTPISPGELTIEATVTTRWAYTAGGGQGGAPAGGATCQ